MCLICLVNGVVGIGILEATAYKGGDAAEELLVPVFAALGRASGLEV